LFLYASTPTGQAPGAGRFANVPYSTACFTPGLNLDYYTLVVGSIKVRWKLP
jgi:hypothetical protein